MTGSLERQKAIYKYSAETYFIAKISVENSRMKEVYTMKSALEKWIVKDCGLLKQSTYKKIKKAVKKLIKTGILLLVIVLVQLYKFFYEHWKGILEAMIAAILAAFFIKVLL